jgi:biotin synthase
MDGNGRANADVRSDWTLDEVRALHALPFADLMHRAQSTHRRHFDPNQVQVSTLLSIKTGACPEDCAYCPQSIRYDTGLEREALMEPAAVVARARAAREAGATRFCMGAAWRSPKDRDLDKVVEMVEGVAALGLETCATLGMLTPAQAGRLKVAGLDYYNHNLDTSEAFYGEVITTRTYQDRLETLAAVRDAGIHVCCGGILGLGETAGDRVAFLHTLATLDPHPESVPINNLVQVEGTPLAGTPAVDPIDFVRIIAIARILMPRSHVRLSAGRAAMSDEMQALCFLAGANSIFYGEKLLTTAIPTPRATTRSSAGSASDPSLPPPGTDPVPAAPIAFEAVLADLDEQGLRRRRRTVRRLSHDTAEIELDGTRCIDFCSNDYLGLSAHPRVTEAFIEAARLHGVGSRASHLITGHQGEHDALEEELAAFTGRERALLFSTGYMANLGLATALVRKGGVVLGDRLNHASLIDAGRIARAAIEHYPHGDAAALDANWPRTHPARSC